jgi:hypothetical protein
VASRWPVPAAVADDPHERLPTLLVGPAALSPARSNLNSNAGTYCDYKLQDGATITVRGMGVVKFAPAAGGAASAADATSIQAIQAERLYVRSIQYNTGSDAFLGTLFSLTNSVVGLKRGVMSLNAARQDGSFLGVATFELSM